ncbi:endonuclease NucS domain-containing protein [Candidatus Bipolaricaulota bacterium]
MPLELGVWRIDEKPVPIETSGIDQEKRLEDILAENMTIASPNWMLIGRQVMTAYGNPIDLLAMDRDGNLVILELKRNKTPREVVAQLIDYASWVKDLRDDDIAVIFEEFQRRYQRIDDTPSLDDAFRDHFSVSRLPDELNDSHSLVVVAAELDSSTERIVRYLSEEHNVPINAVFFRVFRDGESEYLTRAWFIDPTEVESGEGLVSSNEVWNREYYVSFGESDDQHWSDARKYGFVCASGGPWYTRTLRLLEKGGRVWVNVPGQGYVGVGIVTDPVVPIGGFRVQQNDESSKLLSEVPLVAPEMFMSADNPEIAPYLVRVRWIKTVPVEEAVHEKGFLGNQNTVCKPTSKRWQHTVDRLRQHFEVE